MQKTLILGNGLCRSMTNCPDWNDLLQSAGRELGHISPLLGAPYPLDAQRMQIHALQANGNVSHAQAALARTICRLSSNISDSIAGPSKSVHTEQHDLANALVSLPLDNLLTTNYDSAYESVLTSTDDPIKSGDVKKANGEKPIRCSLIMHQMIGDKRVFHIHGSACNPTSICLTYETYFQYLEEIRKDLLSRFGLFGASRPDEDNQPTYETDLDTWPQLFLASDFAFIGLGLDACEITLWWLLEYRASILDRLKKRDIHSSGAFYDIHIAGKDFSESSIWKYGVLHDLGIDVRIITASSYALGYIKALEDLTTRWG